MNQNTGIKIEQPRDKKLHLVEYNVNKKHHREKDGVFASINGKFGMMTIGKNAIVAMEMKNKFVKLSYDAVNKAIAWKLRTSVSPEEISVGWRLVKLDRTGTFRITVRAILDQMLVKKDKSYKKLEIKKYKDYKLLGSEDLYYFVEIK